MAPQNLKNLSAFGQAALTLDSDFTELEQLSGQLERLDIDSDNGLERGRQLLGRFGECGSRIGEGVQGLATNLEASRARAEAAAGTVAVRAAMIQARVELSEAMLKKFSALGEMVRGVTVAMGTVKKLTSSELSYEDRTMLLKHLADLDTQLALLIAEARVLKDEARAVNLKTIERNADSLGQSLDAARRKLSHSVQQAATDHSLDQNTA